MNNKLNNPGSSRIVSGLLLLAAGLLLFAYKMGAPIPGWLFTWPMILILIGVVSGFKSDFRNPGAFVLIAIGSVFLIDKNVPGIDLHNYIAPIILVIIGLVFILKPKGNCNRHQRFGNPKFTEGFTPAENFSKESSSSEENNNPEAININAVFGGVHRKVFSKNFQGGTVTSFMGGTDLNLTQADIKQPVVIEVNNIFGGTKIVIPANWDIKNEISALFGGIEDKRLYNNVAIDTNKIVTLKGSCVFGGIEIANY